MIHTSIGRRKAGATFLESLISVLILGLTIGAMLGAFTMARFNTKMARHRIEAMNYARAAMEQYLNSGTTSITVGGDIALLNGTYSVAVNSYTADLDEVVITVSWDERSLGASNTVSEALVTLILK